MFKNTLQKTMQKMREREREREREKKKEEREILNNELFFKFVVQPLPSPSKYL